MLLQPLINPGLDLSGPSGRRALKEDHYDALKILYRSFKDICVRTFILYGAPFNSIIENAPRPIEAFYCIVPLLDRLFSINEMGGTGSMGDRTISIGWGSEHPAAQRAHERLDGSRQHAAHRQAIRADFAAAFAQNLLVDGDEARAIARRMYDHLNAVAPKPLSKAGFMNVIGVYAEHPHLRASLEAQAPSLTDYLLGALRAFSEDIA